MPQADTIQADSLAQPFYQIGEPYSQTADAELNVGIPLDSLFRPCDVTDTVYRTTLFTGHRLAPQHTVLQQRPTSAMPAWVFVVIVAICALLCLYYRNHKLHLGEMLKSIVDGIQPDRLVRGSVQGIAFLPIVLLLAAALALAVWRMALMDSGVGGYLLLTLAVAAAYLLRNGALSALAAVFDKGQTMSAYITGNYVYHLLLTTAVAPLLFALVYIPGAAGGVAIAIAVLTALVFVIRFLRGAKLFLTISKGFSFFLFYYLCTIEMTPLLVALKWFIWR